MGLFSPSLPYDRTVMEATVTNVDVQRFVCTVKTVRGQYFNEVPWLLPTGGSGKNGMHLCPSVGDQVVVSTGLTYPVIIGSLPRLGQPSTTLTSMSGQELPADLGNNTNIKNGFVTNPAKPSDFTPGDHVITSEGGSILAVQANGSILAKASMLAQIFMSKFDDVVRVVARNWERMSDVSQQTSANVKGRLYEFMGWERKLARSKLGTYELQDVIGDVAAGEVLRGEPNGSTTLPSPDTRVRKYWLMDQAGNTRMVETLNEGGDLHLVIQDVPATTKAENDVTNASWQQKVTNPTVNCRITINPNDITLIHSGGATTVITNDGIHNTYGGHYIHLTNDGVHLG